MQLSQIINNMPVLYTISRRSDGGMSEIHVRFYNGRACDLRARSRIYVPVSTWNAREGRCNISRRYETPDNMKAREAQRKLDELAARITDAYAKAGGRVTREWLQKIVDNESEEKPLAELVDMYCDAKNVAPRTRYKLHAFQKHLVRFEREHRFRVYAHSITIEQIRAFERHMRKIAGVGQNAVASRMKQLRALVYWAGKPYPNPFDEYTMPNEQYGDPFFLTHEELETLIAFDGLSEAKKVQRDIFVFQCNVGCRVSDLYALTEANIKDGWLVYAPQKTQRDTGVIVEIPLTPIAQEIIARYRGVDMSGRLFPFITDVCYNRAIRYILKAAAIERPVIVREPRTGEYKPQRICDIATSHLARRTFTQIAYAATGDQRIVSSMTGHVPHSRAFSRYSEVTRDMKAKALQALE